MEKQITLNGIVTDYWIDDTGKLVNKKTNRTYKGSLSGGYLKYDLRVADTKLTRFAHRLVAEAFIENPNGYPIVNHKDGDKLNNKVDNLEWVTASENNFHAYRTGLKAKSNGRMERVKYLASSDIEGEIWKQYLDSDYMISNMGRARNVKTGNLLKGKVTTRGYIEWCFSILGTKKSLLAHRVVFSVFGDPLKEGLTINHKDGNKENNAIANLEQIPIGANIQHSFDKIGHKNVRQVGKFSLDGTLLATYNSCAEAARENPGTFSNLINKTCNGLQQYHKGFKWKYINE